MQKIGKILKKFWKKRQKKHHMDGLTERGQFIGQTSKVSEPNNLQSRWVQQLQEYISISGVPKNAPTLYYHIKNVKFDVFLLSIVI